MCLSCESFSVAAPGETKVLFVKNLSFDLTTDTLKEAFEGSTEARIATHPDSGKSKGFGFVEFDSVEACKAAHEAMQGQEIEGREVVVDFSLPRGQGGSGGGKQEPFITLSIIKI